MTACSRGESRPIAATAAACSTVGASSAALPPVPSSATFATTAVKRQAADATPPRASNAPLVRATKWVCDEQFCEGKPVIAYDYLPAVTESGDLAALVEERDGWGHTARVGIHLVGDKGERAFLPAVTGGSTRTFAEYARKADAHKAAIDTANAALATHPLRPLYRLSPAGEEVLVNGAWVAATSSDQPGKRRRAFTYDRVRVVVTAAADDTHAETRFDSLAIIVDGKEVARKSGAELPDRAGCSARRMLLEGVRAESKALAVTYTNGLTTHACDGNPEPQVHHLVRW